MAPKISASSTAEYFSNNLQQVGFSSPSKAVLTTLKEALDNALDACEEHRILPDISVVIKKLGKGSLRNTDKLSISVTDNGPGLELRISGHPEQQGGQNNGAFSISGYTKTKG